MNNQIKNKKTEVSTGIKLNEKDYLSCLLSTLKDIEKNYTIALTEASNEQLYQHYIKMFNEYSNLQRLTYELMFKHGWYILETAEQNKISNKYQTLSQELNDLKN